MAVISQDPLRASSIQLICCFYLVSMRVRCRASMVHAEPDFLGLAKKHLDLAPYVRVGQHGHGMVDFTNFEASRCVAACMLALMQHATLHAFVSQVQHVYDTCEHDAEPQTWPSHVILLLFC